MRKATKKLIAENTGFNLHCRLSHLQDLGCNQQLIKKGAGLGESYFCFPSLGDQCRKALQHTEQSLPSQHIVGKT